MANIKISELPAASAASATQEFETNDSGTSKKVTGSQLKSFVKSGLAVSDVTDLTATAAELNFTDGVTSPIQTQLNSKAPSASPVFSGNISLGVTPFAWGVDRVAFDLKNTAAYSAPSNFGGLANNAYYNGTGWVYKYSDFAQAYEQGGGFHAWYTASSGTAGNPVTWSKRLSINSSGAFGFNNDYGTSGQVVTSNGSGSAVTWAKPKVDPDYDSGEFSTAINGRYTFAHGLGVLPNRMDIVMRLTAAVGGWSAGTYFVCDGNNMFYDGANPGVVTGYDATNIYTQIGSDFRFLSTAGARTSIPFASAVFRVRAWK